MDDRGGSTGNELYEIARTFILFITVPFVLDLHVKYSVFMGLYNYLMRE